MLTASDMPVPWGALVGASLKSGPPPHPVPKREYSSSHTWVRYELSNLGRHLLPSLTLGFLICPMRIATLIPGGNCEHWHGDVCARSLGVAGHPNPSCILPRTSSFSGMLASPGHCLLWTLGLRCSCKASGDFVDLVVTSLLLTRTLSPSSLAFLSLGPNPPSGLRHSLPGKLEIPLLILVRSNPSLLSLYELCLWCHV